MKVKSSKLLFLIGAPALSGILLVWAFPAYGRWWLAWAGLVPLMVTITGRRPAQGFLLSFICSVIYFPGVFYWMLEVPGYTVLHHTVLGIYLGSYFGLFGLIFCLVSNRFGTTSAMFSAPFIWVALEYIRSNLSFMALPMALLGHSQHEILPVIQIASFTGTYGLSFFIVLVNAALACTVLYFCKNIKSYRFFNNVFLSSTGTISMIAAAVSLTGLALAYGYTTLSRPVEGEKLKFSVIQGNISSEKKWDKEFADEIMKTYMDLSLDASRDNPDLIVWPEASTPGFVMKKTDLLKKMASLIRQTKTHFLIGSSEYPKFQKFKPDMIKAGNTALLFALDGRIKGQYVKKQLVPFKEYVPYEGIIPWPEFIVSKVPKGSFIKGKKFTLFDIDGKKFSSVICWETLYPELFRQFVKKGANLIINIANEGWFEETACPYHFLSINIFRAVENRVSVVRATNTGISCFIDPYGRITDRLHINNKEIFVKGHLTREAVVSKKKSFYTIYGDILAYMSLLITFIMISLSFKKNCNLLSKKKND